MNGVALAVHQSSSRIEKRKLVSITRSPSVAVVSEMAPRWMTASSLRPFSQSASSAGGTMSASWRLARFLPLAVMAEQVADHDVAAARVVQRGHDVRPDKTGATGHQQHAVPA